MTATELLKSILPEKYISEDGDEYSIELKPGLDEQELNELARKLPTGQIPGEIRELLQFARGLEFEAIGEITFDAIEQFGFQQIFPHAVQLAGDGFGNFWILDIHKNGQWGNVFYVCHDRPVIVKHSENLANFIEHVNEFGKDLEESNLKIIHEEVVEEIWSLNPGFMDLETAKRSSDPVLKEFSSSLPDNFVVADLRKKPIRSGFAWGKFGPDIDKAVRHESELLWGIEKKVKKGFFSRLFGG